MTYAKGTSVDAGRSKDEIERMFVRFGCDDYSYGTSIEKKIAYVSFKYANKKYLFDLSLPNPDDFMTTKKGRDRVLSVARKEWEQAVREKWRLLAQMIKMTLLWIESGSETFERAFAGRLLTKSGKTIGDLILDDIEQITQDSKLKLLN